MIDADAPGAKTARQTIGSAFALICVVAHYSIALA
jgi:hypothetical protein